MARSVLLVSLVSLFALACATTQSSSAIAVLESRSGSAVSGTVSFTDRGDGSVIVAFDLRGATPGMHGFHVHENGDCSAADASSAGGHFNPTGAVHGGPVDAAMAGEHAGHDMPATHAGDFGNLSADANGVIRQTFATRSITIDPGVTTVIGKAVVLHADPDDIASQPAGNSGKRIACGVVTMAGSLQKNRQ